MESCRYKIKGIIKKVAEKNSPFVFKMNDQPQRIIVRIGLMVDAEATSHKIKDIEFFLI